MANREFTAEELVEIRNNPFVKSETHSQIRFTTEFKSRFGNAHKPEGTDPLIKRYIIY